MVSEGLALRPKVPDYEDSGKQPVHLTLPRPWLDAPENATLLLCGPSPGPHLGRPRHAVKTVEGSKPLRAACNIGQPPACFSQFSALLQRSPRRFEEVCGDDQAGTPYSSAMMYSD